MSTIFVFQEIKCIRTVGFIMKSLRNLLNVFPDIILMLLNCCWNVFSDLFEVNCFVKNKVKTIYSGNVFCIWFLLNFFSNVVRWHWKRSRIFMSLWWYAITKFMTQPGDVNAIVLKRWHFRVYGYREFSSYEVLLIQITLRWLIKTSWLSLMMSTLLS